MSNEKVESYPEVLIRVSETSFRSSFGDMQRIAGSIAARSGWRDADILDKDGMRCHGEQIALIHSEPSEALEALRKGNPPDKDCPQFSSAEVEMADTIIRIMDYADERGWDVAGALCAKMRFNANRPYRHGGKAF